MTEKKASENQIAPGIINYSAVLRIPVKLDSSNWGSWSLFVRKGLTSVGKEDHITTRLADPISREWLIDDSGIQMALWNAMEPQILTITQNFPIVKDMWEHLSSSFSDKESLSHAYSVVQSYIRAEQGDSSFTDYFTRFSTIRDELRSMFPPTTDLKVQEERNAKMDIMTFIAGISPKYSSARPLLLNNPAATSSIASMYHLLREMYGPNETRPSTDTSAMHTPTSKGIGRGSHKTHKKGIGRGSGPICHYCKEPGHTKWDCPNRPPGSQPPPRPKARIATTSEASDPNATPAYTFSEEDYCRLQHLLASQTTPPAPSAKAANSGTFPSLSSSWVIDSGATDHMTGNSGILSNLHNVSHQPDYVGYSHLSPEAHAYSATLDSYPIPKNVTTALAHPGWRQAIEEELGALRSNHTWDLVTLPVGKRIVGCRWVFTVNLHPDGSLHRLKARLVAKGYSQAYGIDYEETFSPVAKMPSVRICIALAAINHWPLHQLDIKNTFLNGVLEEEVYMEQPPGFIIEEAASEVCRLRRSLYGLKQSPRAWFGRFSNVMEQFGMTRSAYDHSVFFIHQRGKRIIVVVYVDDIIITDDDAVGITELKQFLQTQFQVSDLDRLKYFLGIEVSRSSQGILLSQRKYVLDMLTEYGLLGCKPVDTPMLPTRKLLPEEGDPMKDPERYRRLVGKLNNLTVTRPDISFTVSVLSQFMAAPHTSHWDAALRVLRYLKTSPGLSILYSDQGHYQVGAFTEEGDGRISGFSDADWAGCPISRRYTTGYCVFVEGNLVSWKSKKQQTVSRSSAALEYRAMADVTSEMTWARRLLIELGMNRRVRNRTQKSDLSDQPEMESEDCHIVDWIRLHDDLVVKIFTHLSYRDRANLSSTCKTWRSAGSSSSLWQSIDLRPHKCESGLMNVLSSRCSNLRKLRFSGSDSMDSLVNLRAEGLRELRGSYCREITDANLAHIVAHHSLLESIELGPDFCEGITSEAVVAIALGCPRLKKLRLSGISNVNSAAISSLANNCPHLQELAFVNCLIIDEAALGNVVSLQFLSVAGTTHIDWNLAGNSWGNLRNLEGLDVSRTDAVPSVVRRLFRSLNSLKLLCAFNSPLLDADADLHDTANRLGIMMLGFFNDTFKELSRMFPCTFSEWRNRLGKKEGNLDEFMSWVEWILSFALLHIADWLNTAGFEEFWVNQGVCLLLNLLQSSQEDVQEYAAMGLAAFTVVVDGVPMVNAILADAVIISGGVELLLGLATSVQEGIQKEATKAIANLSVDPVFAKTVAGRGGITILASLTKSLNRWVAGEAVGGLWNLSSFDEHKGAIGEASVIKSLVDLTVKWPGFDKLLERVAGVLGNLAFDDMCSMEMAALGGINALITLACICECEDVQKEAVRALGNLALDDRNREYVALAGGLEPLVALAETCITASPSLQARVAVTLWSLSASEFNKITIGREGGVAALIRLATTNIQDAQSMAAGALWCLASSPENALRIVEDGGIPVLVGICSTGSQMGRFMAALALAYVFDGRVEDYAPVDFESARITNLKCIEDFVSIFVDPHMFTGVSLSSVSASLAQATEAVCIVETGQLLCSPSDIRRFVSMLRNKSPVLKSLAAFALLQFTVPGGRNARHHVNLLQEAGASRVLRVTSAAAAGPFVAKICAKIVLRNLEHQEMSSA
ncbi:protein ARABIDILLO 2-like [Bidens hawaiensis]|uniref:protein ARABIDILLO 2-like n=1 Tax=Bidens hawaiensis TaxID=980011 RepID=UPI00404A3523